MKKQFTLLLLIFTIGTTYAQKSITQLNVPYFEDFNSLNNSANDNVMPTGWFFTEGGANADNTYAPSTGSATAGNTYSYGSASSTDRALGTLASANNRPTIGVSFTNNTGATVDSISISYYVEQWRLGATGRTDSLTAQWSPNGTFLWFDLPLLNIRSVVTSGTIGALDGNANANRAFVAHTLPVPAIANGVTVWLRWVDNDIAGTADDGLAIDDFTIIAYGSSGTSDPDPCTQPFFSEYIEGSGNNKVLEIYNPASQSINLSNYLVFLFSDGSSTPTDTLMLSGSLASGDVYVISNVSANQSILNVADTTHSIAGFDGNDALAIVNLGTGGIVDVFGLIGKNPGTNWPIDTGATSEYTLVRKDTVRNGTTDSATWASGWDVYAQNTTTYLGAHTSDCVVPQTTKTVTFTSILAVRTESDDSVAVGITVINPDLLPVTVDVNLGNGTTANAGSDYDYTPRTLVFSGGSTDTQYVYIRMYDDMVFEPNKVVQLVLEDALGGAEMGDSVFTLIIRDNDPMPVSQIANINNVNANGVAIHMDSLVKIGGIVHDFNHSANSAGLHFAIQNRNEGIVVYHATDTLGYSVRMGDSIVVVGTITQTNGLTEIEADSIFLISTNNSMYAPKATNTLSEATEAILVTLPAYRLVNPTQWGSGSTFFNTQITNGTDTFIMVVHDETDLFNASAPTGYFNVRGIGWQFDNSAPYLSGYQIVPRSIADITALADPTITFVTDSQYVNEDADTVNVEITINNATAEAQYVDVEVHSSSTATAGSDYIYTTKRITFPANSTSTQIVTLTIIDDTDSESDETIVLVLRDQSAFARIGSDSIHVITIIDNDPNSINDEHNVKVQLYPNPAENFAKIVSAEPIQTITITGSTGKRQLRMENLNNNEYQVNLDNLASGVYIITIEGKNYRTTKQLMVK